MDAFANRFEGLLRQIISNKLNKTIEWEISLLCCQDLDETDETIINTFSGHKILSSMKVCIDNYSFLYEWDS